MSKEHIYRAWPEFHELWKRGFSVIPIAFKGKKPVVKWDGYQSKRPTYDELEGWFTSEPRNAAIVTGKVSGVVVLDIDGDKGMSSLAAVKMPRTPVVKTGRGYHYYFKYPEDGIGNRAGLLPGVDLRGDGGYVITPPSVHENQHAYEWVTNLDTPLAEMPDWLFDLLEDKGTAFGRSVLNGEIEKLTRVREGERNDSLNISACKVANAVAAGELPQDCAKEALREVGLAIGLEEKEVDDTIESGFCRGSKTPRGSTVQDKVPATLNVRKASTITPKPIDWLWPGVLPKAFCMIAGNAKVGKSSAIVDLAAIVSKGRSWPGSTQKAVAGNVLMLNTEDNAEWTITPRLIAAGADLERVDIIDSVGADERGFSLDRDIPLVREYAEKLGNVSLIVVDPVNAYLGSKKINDSGDVRGITEPLGRLAHDLGICVLGVTHFGKDRDRDALHRFLGSVSWGAAARANFAIERIGDRRILASAGTNLGADDNAYGFTIEEVDLGNGIKTTRAVWEDRSHKATADQVLSEKTKDGTLISEVENIIRTELAHGCVLSTELKDKVLGKGYSPSTYRDAYGRVGVVFKREKGAKGKWFAILPEHEAAWEEMQALFGRETVK